MKDGPMKLDRTLACTIAFLALALVACAPSGPPADGESAPDDAALQAITIGEPADDLIREGETHFANLRQLTFGGENAEAYWSQDGTKLVFQSKRDGRECDQVYVLDLLEGTTKMVSTGGGACTCAYWFPAGDRILYSSTHLASESCPPPPDYSRGYVWRLHPEHDIFTAAPDGTDVVRLTDAPGYDAEATVSVDGSKIIFTSIRDGDLDLYTMNPDGSDVTRITDTLGYDGGAFFSRDGSKIVWRASRPTTDEEVADYRGLLAEQAIRPMVLEIFVANADGTDARQVTDSGAASFGPYFFPDADRIIFSSNAGDPGGRNFDLWMVNVDGTGMEQVTFEESFDGFPMFSPDGTRLVFASNRGGSERGETNLFLADWVD
jgi:Tol biopolymer transport system component